MLPIELDISSHRVAENYEEVNDIALRANLDLAEEDQSQACIRNFAARQRAARKYNLKVIQRQMQAGDLVLRRRTRANVEGKLAANWEGPFRVTTPLSKGAYKLEELDGTPVPRSWNATNLRLYFS